MSTIPVKDIKRYDTMYSILSKLTTEELSTAIINRIHMFGFMDTLLQYIRTGYDFHASLLFKVVDEIAYYREILLSNLRYMFMALLPSPKMMKYALNFYEKYASNRIVNFTDQMIICVYRHSLIYPEMKEGIRSFLKGCNLSHITDTNPIFFIDDNSEFACKYLSRNKMKEAYLTTHALNNDSVDCLYKLCKYYNINKNIITKLSFPEFNIQTKKFNIHDENFRTDVFCETMMFAKYDFLPFIFETYKLNDKDWFYIRNGLYNNYFTLPFYLALVNFMKIYNYDIKNLFKDSSYVIHCTHEIASEIIKSQVLDFVPKLITEEKPSAQSYCVPYLFEMYRAKMFSELCNHYTINLINHNKRILRELNYVKELVDANIFNWDKELTFSFQLFYKFTINYSEQLCIFDQVLLKYNSFISMIKCENMLSLRLINSIKLLADDIKSNFIRTMSKEIFESIETFHLIHYTGILKDLYVSENKEFQNLKWKLSKNSTLEEILSDIYLNSELEEGPEQMIDGMKLADKLKKMGCHKIGSEIENMAVSYVPYEKIVKALQLKNIHVPVHEA